ncbi:aldehyde oxidase GLOX-like [Amaranthus tricolor]|uniref:aldehyde oxidase GLOX-like n=1 Tax=Amaranthus tricolor TaxID=29722 RepID=UPI002586B1A4|nr:aldehyde oxidase GLOX-like [Amaranthus tricolor]
MSNFLLLFSLLSLFSSSITAQGGGRWELLQESIGISAMHMQLLGDDRVIIYDRTDFGPSNLTLTESQCSLTPRDCTAHSAEYDSLTNTFRPLVVITNNWCSSGSTLSDGTLVQTGGWRDGDKVVRTFTPFCNDCDWVELPNKLLQRRWYASNHALPDGRLIIVGGTQAFNYEFFPKTPSSFQLFKLPFLQQTTDPRAENNLYPFVFLHVDGNLFIFANNRAILFDYTKDVVVRSYPTIPGGDPRSYPSTGSAVLLPLKNLELGLKIEAEVLICGGAPTGSYLRAQNSGQFLTALKTCARLKYTDPEPSWIIETMPMARVMGDMVLLPNEDVLLINGAGRGTAGWELGRDPVLTPVIYHPDNTPGSRFETQNPNQIPRMYHSCAVLLRDGRVLVGGSNPHQFYNFTNVLFPTELSLEAFSPPYLDPANSRVRPTIISPKSGLKITYGKHLSIKFTVSGSLDPSSVKVTLLRPPFNTHSFSMSQRLLVLTNKQAAMPVIPALLGRFKVKVITPRTTNIAPPGYYLLFVVHQGIPSKGIWVQLT